MDFQVAAGHRIKVQVFTMVTGLVPDWATFILASSTSDCVNCSLFVVVTVSSTTNTVLSDRAYAYLRLG